MLMEDDDLGMDGAPSRYVRLGTRASASDSTAPGRVASDQLHAAPAPALLAGRRTKSMTT